MNAAPEPRSTVANVWWPVVPVLGVLVLAGAFLREPGDATASAIGGVLAVLACALLARLGGRAVLPLTVVVGVGVVLDAGTNGSDIAWFSLCVLVFATGLTQGRAGALVVWALAMGLLGLEWIVLNPNLGWMPWMAGVTVCLGAAIGVLHERKLLSELRAAQAGLAERSRAQERNRIARDLHDVIAHSLTVSLLHISSARLAVSHDPDDAARALAEAERLGRASLDEVRTIVGLMRNAEGSSGSLAPVQGIDTIADLVTRFQGAGADAAITVEGDLSKVPGVAGATLVRIAQEALTNAAKHAPGAAVRVALSASSGEVVMSVVSFGAPGSGQGMGLETMRERAEAIGGVCEAGPFEQGWRVRAAIPCPRRALRGAA